jgi:hypothetical protein
VKADREGVNQAVPHSPKSFPPAGNRVVFRGTVQTLWRFFPEWNPQTRLQLNFGQHTQ